VSAGQVVKAMIMNCMGFLTAPLYLFSEFFSGKATEHLLGEGVKAEYLNDSRLGRVLEQLYEYGVSFLFIKIALVMVERFGIKISSGHIDGTSMSVEGKYIQSEEKESSTEDVKEKEGEDEPVPIRINHGYSRDHRADLKQFTFSLLTVGEEGIPLFMQVGDGNKLDSQAFPEMIKAFQSQWQGEKLDLFVMDAAFYDEKNLMDCQEGFNWISRVPLTIKAAQELTKTLLPEQFTKSSLYEGYRFCTVCSEYAGVKQQWVVVESEQRK
jgi:transposase